MDPPLQQFLETQPVVTLRTKMPELQQGVKHPHFVSMLKEFIGKDINSPMPLPISFAEPSAELAKRAEDIEYSELLDEAAELPRGGLALLLKVAAFALSPYGACHTNRTCKPLFSAPCETLEAVYPEKGVRYLAEMIQDGGWIVAGHMEGRKWTLATEDQAKPKLWGTSMDFLPHWWLELTFHDGEVFTWQKAITSVNNMLAGEMFVAHRGALKVHQKSADRVATLKFKEPGMATLSTKARKIANRPVSGYIEESGKKLQSPRFSGFWDSHLEAVFDDSSENQPLWKIHRLPENGNRFQMTHFICGLTDLPAEMKPLLPPTDSRLRKDARLLEKGLYEQACAEKERLEEKMFARVHAAPKKNGKPFIQPRWFVPAAGCDDFKPGEGLRWRYNSKYWAARAAGFAGMEIPDIFSD